MLKQTLSQKMLQKLSPQQIQLMKLLQIPTAALEERIKEEMEVNPALEESEREAEDMSDFETPQEDNFDYQNDEDTSDPEQDNYREESLELENYLNDYLDDDPGSYKLRDENYGAPEEEKTTPVPVENTFHDYLEEQLGLLQLRDEREFTIARQIIGSIDEDGYLRRDVTSIIDDLMFTLNIFTDEKEVEKILRKIQRFDPPGIGARDLQECLRIQLEIKLDQEGLLRLDQEYLLRLALQVINDYFEEFTKKHYEKLQRQLDAPDEDLKEAIEEILKLNPKPASGYAGNAQRNAQYIVPDFLIFNRDGELELTLNTKNAPDLRISDQYRDMLKSYKKTVKGRKATRQEKEAVLFIKQKIDSAKWFIDAIKQRQHTMETVMYAIMQYQADYFLSGDEKKLKPMILKDIADITGLDISTVSRVANSKYVQTEFGSKRLKDFFSEALSTQEGEEVSTLEVKKILKEVIEAENKRKPLSDEHLKDLLQEKGYNIARRTVAKYREQLGIPVARLRKEL
ncbi:MAG: RNA polymerase factor sigma-54 [Lewinellaceae bacterium]|nr:RNA polymerase factor sigma-54 [Lewinella sp.]MCB9277761.1 RNA polymerase factor sigma-54 [Lewinellaceae bacterium]